MPLDANRSRRSIRLPDYDYRTTGAYFVTICTYQREMLFDDPALRDVVKATWQHIPHYNPRAQLDSWVVMPNHLHGIIVLAEEIEKGKESPGSGSLRDHITPAETNSVQRRHSGEALPLLKGVLPGSLGAIIGNFKSVTARRINQLRHTPGQPVWQRNYYEHIVRDERALNAIRQYIADNPARWMWDTYNPSAAGPDTQAADLWQLLREGPL